MQPSISKEQYLQKGGGVCLYCKSLDVDGTFIDPNAGYARQGLRCNECGAAWTDTYKLTDVFIDLEPEHVKD